MNDGLLVAVISVVGSAITVVANTALTMWGKWVDSHQKTDEHKYAIRSVYVNKKIEATQSFINFNSIKKAYIASADQALQHYLAENEPSAHFEHLANEFLSVEIELVKNGGICIDLYYDISKFLDEYNQGAAEANRLGEVLGKINDSTREEFIINAKALTTINLRLIQILNEMNGFVREDLTKYDIL